MSAAALTLTAATALAVQCAPDVAPGTLTAIWIHEGRGVLNPYAIGINHGPRLPKQPTSATEAVAVARRLLAQGRDFDAGLGQINVRNWRWLGLDAETVFDPCRNAAASAAVLTAFSRYSTGTANLGFANGYVQGVVAAGRANAAAPSPAAAPSTPEQPPPAEPPPCAPSFDSWALALCRERQARARHQQAPAQPTSPDAPKEEYP
ncbi:lytic transglycosylase domain-containing protein [Paracraurococcus lichenis]|uniref:Lytic transglycosylase domain-containing protein n=1 Tax=Paracraurococcus lichenis TaxID=3064888 RepID=A0ABT9EAL8_9PROT|nr:lytic transglycosylase domain-containing protein [Paracraurococcus sp. LOR1-02]MDO9713248.1 lytic transglycosylase domain-containing protein [Paracraurococcus sp. LOR1-02]